MTIAMAIKCLFHSMNKQFMQPSYENIVRAFIYCAKNPLFALFSAIGPCVCHSPIFFQAKCPMKLSPARKIKPLPFTFIVSKSEMEMRYSEEKYNALNENARLKLVFSEIEKLLNDLEVSHYDHLLKTVVC